MCWGGVACVARFVGFFLPRVDASQNLQICIHSDYYITSSLFLHFFPSFFHSFQLIHSGIHSFIHSFINSLFINSFFTIHSSNINLCAYIYYVDAGY